MSALIQYLPDFMRVLNAEVLPQARTELEAAKEISPEYARLGEELYREFAPLLAKTGVDVERINRTGAADTDLEIMRGSGKDLVTEAQALDRQLNPEFYKAREGASAKLEELLGSINLNDANPEAERLINQENLRTGNAGVESSTGTVANALSFGSALSRRRSDLANAINTATTFMQPSQGQFNPVQTALNRPSTNTGESRFTGVEKPGGQAYAAGQGLMNNITSIKMQENDINANRRDILDRFNESLSSIPT